jgi:hypothetical protein
MRFTGRRRLALVAATGCLAWTLVGCDLGEPPRVYEGMAAVGVGDANGDGHLDLVTISDPQAHEGLVIRFGDGTGDFPTSQHVPPRSGHCTPNQDCWGFDRIMVDDFTGDRTIDVVQQVVRSRPDAPALVALELRVNDGTGQLGEPILLKEPTTTDWLGTFGDVTGDGLPDMVTNEPPASGRPRQILVRPNDGTGRFGPVIPSVYGHRLAMDIDLGDFDSDGHTDLLLFSECFTSDAAEETRACVEMRRGDSSGRFTPGVPVLATDPEAVNIRFPAITHLDGDGHLDVVGAWPGGPITAFYGDGRGGFTPATVPTPAGTVDATAADLDSDGHTDLLVTTNNRNADRQDDWAQVVFGDGARGFGPTRLTGGYSPVIADFDADERPDYVASAWSCDCSLPDRIEVYMNRWDGHPT